MTNPMLFNNIESCIDALFAAVGNRIVLGIPLGIGKPNTFVNALYRRVKENPAFHLKIITALSLSKPQGHSDLEKRFLEPLVDRVFGDYPDLDYALDQQKGHLPSNVEVMEFFLKTGDYLDNPTAQQQYIYSNYSHVARDMLVHGVNVLAQAVAVREDNGVLRYSLSSNPDITIDALDLIRADPARKVMVIGVVNHKMPFMPNQAEVPADDFNFMVDDAAGTHDLFAPPNMKVTLQDYAIGMHASSLVKDGGTLQIGIGSLGDAISQALIVRDQNNNSYRQILNQLSASPAGPDLLELGTFEHGLYGCSEMFVNGFMRLMEAGIIRREVYNHAGLQQLLNEKRIQVEVTPDILRTLLEEDLIRSPLTEKDVAFLKKFGIFRDDVEWREGRLYTRVADMDARIDSPSLLEGVARACLGEKLKGGIIMHGGFFLGPRDFYQKLRDMPDDQLNRIEMSRIGFINQLYGQEDLARAQRQHARFINTTMMMTLLGAAVSDSLDSGKLVSGVGGQYNFVAMGHEIRDARSVLMLRASRISKGEPVSNIVWNYAHTTIPRHLRDVVITEYGVADLRGQPDAEVIKRLLAIADSRFQEDLLAQAKENGKVEVEYQIPDAYRHNLPDVLEARLQPWRETGLLPDFPFGTDFTPDELKIVRALQKLKHAVEHPLELVSLVMHGLFGEKNVPDKYLERMGFTEVHGLRQRLMRTLFVGNF